MYFIWTCPNNSITCNTDQSNNSIFPIQVLSKSVSKALQLTGGDEATETAHFASMIDKLFDSLNVHSYVLRIHSRKKLQMPYTSGDDMHL